MFGVMQHLNIEIFCKDAADAVERGFNYREPQFKAITIERVVIVKQGTEGGNSSIDLILKDEQGQRYVVMLTGNLLKSLPL